MKNNFFKLSFVKSTFKLSTKFFAMMIAMVLIISSLFVFGVAATEETPMVLKLEAGATGQPFFGQAVSVDPTKTYVFSYYYTHGFDPNVRVYDNGSETSVTDHSISYDDDWIKVNMEFKANSTAPDDTNIQGNKIVWVGFRGQNASTPLYFYGLNLYEVGNAETNLLQDPNLLQNGNSIDKTVWKSPYGTAIKSTYSKVTLDSIGGMDYFKMPHMSLKLAAESTGSPWFGQKVSLDPTKEYVFTFYYTQGYHAYGYAVNYNSETYATTSQATNDVEWSKYSLKFKANESAPDDTDISGNKLMWVGLRGEKASVPLYYYGFNLYDVENPSVNLLQDPYLANGSGIDTTIWKTPYGTAIKSTYSKVSIESLGGVEFFKKDPMVLKLEAGTTGMPFFGQAVSVDPTKTYVFSYYYTHGFDPNVRVYDNLTETAVTDHSISYDGDWAKVNMEFKANSTAPDDTNIQGNKIVWVGLRGQNASTPLYFYGLNLYEVGNAETNLLQDPNFLQNGSSIDTTVWKSPYSTAIKSSFSKVSLDSIGGVDAFLRPLEFRRCDINADGIINILDLVRLKRYATGVITTLPQDRGDLDGNGTIADENDFALLRLELLK